jgi:hypothetical protein
MLKSLNLLCAFITLKVYKLRKADYFNRIIAFIQLLLCICAENVYKVTFLRLSLATNGLKLC